MGRFVCGGLATFDLAYYAEVLPARGHKGTASRSYMDVGGPVANAAVAAVLLGSDAVVHSVFGAGLFSGEAIQLLSRYGVEVVDHDPTTDLPVASVWIDGTGERTIVSTDNRRSEVLGKVELVDLDGVAAILLDGHYPKLQTVLARAAVAVGVPIVLDCGRWRPIFSDLLPLATDVIMTGTFRPPDLGGSTVSEAVVAIGERYGPDLVAASRGPEPIIVARGRKVVEVPVPEVEVIDTTGAGDVLHGAYLHYRYGDGLGPVESLEMAAVAASRSCRALGARQLFD